MTLLRQGASFVLAGLAQLALDGLLFIVLTAVGLPIVPSNVLARASGMLLGFWLNGRFTFAATGTRRLGWHRFGRFICVWALLTLFSTLLVGIAADRLGLRQAWLAKPLVEALLAAVSFLLLRGFVYR